MLSSSVRVVLLYALALASGLALSACSDLDIPGFGSERVVVPKIDGERIAVLRQDSDVMADDTLQDLPIEFAAPKPLDAWPQHAGDARGYATTMELPSSLARDDSTTIGGSADFDYGVVVSPIIAQGSVFVMDAEGYISAHSASDIDEELWVSEGVANADETAMIGGGLAFDNGALFAVSGNGLIAAFDPASGLKRWRQDIRIPVRAPPLVAAGKVFIVTTDSKLFTLDAATGDVIWEEQGMSEGASFLANAAPVYYNGLLAVPYASAELRVITADEGRTLWGDVLALTKRQMAASNFSGIGGAPVIADNAVYAVSTAGVLAAYRLDNGRRIWEQPISSSNRPWVSGNAIFVLSTQGQVIALNRFDGRIYWVAKIPAYENENLRLDPYHWSGPVLAGETLYIASSHGVMKRFDARSGTELEALDIPNNVLSAPVIAGQRMYLVSKDAALHVLY